MNRRLAIAFFLMMVAPCMKAAPLTFERGLMGTRFAITCYHEDEAQAASAANAAFEAAECINQVASDYIADSELLSLSKHPAGSPVSVSPLLYQMISEARDLAEKTNGLFDPALGPLTKLWRESRRRHTLPDEVTLTAARAASSWHHLVLNPQARSATFMKPAMRLDLGSLTFGNPAEIKAHGGFHESRGASLRIEDKVVPTTCGTGGSEGDIVWQ